MQNRWLSLMERLSLPENIGTFNKLIEQYSESHRAYHNIQHIEACLKHLSEFKKRNNNFLSEREFILLEVAIWFHDAIYKPFSSKNEKESADFCESFLCKNTVNELETQFVYQLIMITMHNQETQTPAEELMMDLDLSILGSSEGVYEEYEINIRKEYRWVPKSLFNNKRAQILNYFIGQKNIFKTKHFNELFEDRARRNLSRALDKLS